ncbi:MAG: universal stress protein [Planctomycetaceae bacterium]
MKKILLATDGSEFADVAARFLAHLPRHERSELIVVTVLEDPSIARSYESAVYLKASVEQERQAADEAFARIKQMFDGADLSLRSIIEVGHRGETIVELAKTEQVDLVVVGARGHSLVSRMLLGSTSDFVATHAPCSVLVVRPSDVYQSDRPLRVAIGYDGSDAARAAVKEFSEVSWGRNTEVHVVSVVSYLAGFLNEAVQDTESIRLAALASVQHAAAELQPVAPNASARVLISDHVGEGLVRFAEERQCDLVVIGETPRTAIGRFLMGSFSRFVLRHSPSSVWISRHKDLSS